MRHSSLLISLSLATLLLTPLPVFAANFSDVADTHTHAQAIQTLKDAGILNGYPDGTFKPDQSVSRAETVAIILRALSITAVQTSATLPFTDVGEGQWFFPVIQKGVALGKIDGYDDKTFRPENPVNLPEALKFALSFYGISTKKVPYDAVIYDGLKKYEWYSTNAQYAKNQNLIEPDENGQIDPLAAVTRSELAELIHRLRIVRDTGRPFDLTQNWATTEHADNNWKLKHPPQWEVFKGIRNSVLWKKDEERVFFTRIWPSSAQLSISLIENTNSVSAATYFANLRASYEKNYKKENPVFTNVTLGGRSALKIMMEDRRTIDAVIALPTGNFLVLYGEYGEGKIGEFLKKQLDAMISSYAYVAKPATPPPPVIPLSERMEILRENVLVSGGWKNVEKLFSDKTLFSTDAIGIGTGPVDYYYSGEANYSIKLERGSATILNIHGDKTSAF